MKNVHEIEFTKLRGVYVVNCCLGKNDSVKSMGSGFMQLGIKYN